MKNQIRCLFLALSLLAPNAYAVEYSLSPGAIAELTSASGFVHPSAPIVEGVRILEQGTVEYFAQYRDGRQTATTIATMSAERLEAVLHNLSTLSDSELVPQDPRAPLCQDAPSRTYVGRNQLGDAVPLKGTYNCKQYIRVDYAAPYSTQVLDGLFALALL